MTEEDTIRHKEAWYSNKIQISLEIKKKKPRKLPLIKYGILPQVDLVQRVVELSKAEKHRLRSHLHVAPLYGRDYLMFSYKKPLSSNITM